MTFPELKISLSLSLDRMLRFLDNKPEMCNCKFAPYKSKIGYIHEINGQEESWHFLRKCEYCNEEWYSLHCPHDKIQNPCPKCGKIPVFKPENGHFPYWVKSIGDEVKILRGGLDKLEEWLKGEEK